MQYYKVVLLVVKIGIGVRKGLIGVDGLRCLRSLLPWWSRERGNQSGVREKV